LAAGVSLRGFLGPAVHAELGIPHLGGDGRIPELVAEGCRFLVVVGHVGDPAVRRSLWTLVEGHGFVLVAPTATVSVRARLGEGTVALHHAHVGPGAVVGCNAILNTRSVVEHDAVVGAHAHVATGAIVNGGCQIGEGVLVGSGAVILQGRSISPGTVVGAGAVVTRDIVDGGIWTGVPARRIR
jgi:sugar O-acyltransferase (sialic acid O-acetyltransferase NeuD family)